MLIPGKMAWSVSNINRDIVQKEKASTEENLQLFDGQMDDAFAGLSEAMRNSFEQASGTSFDDLMADAQMKAAASACAAGAQAAEEEQNESFGSDDELRGGRGTDARMRMGGQRISITVVTPAAAKSAAASKRAASAKSSSKKTCRAATPTKRQVITEEGDTEKTKAGRKKQNPVKVLREVLTEFDQCQEAQKWFAKKDCFRRSLERQIKDLELLIENDLKDNPLADCGATPDELDILKKESKVALELARMWMKSGEQMSDAMFEKFVSQSQFCALKPVARVRAPMWLRLLCLTQQCEDYRI